MLIGLIDNFADFRRPKYLLINSKQNFKIFAPVCKIISIGKVHSAFRSFNQSTFNQESINSKLKEELEGCLVYLTLSWQGKVFLKFGNQVKSTIACIGLYLKLKIYEQKLKSQKKNIQEKTKTFFTSPGVALQHCISARPASCFEVRKFFLK